MSTLNTQSGGTQAGLFSAVSSTFIIDVRSKLEPDPNEMTTAYIQILVHAVNNSLFPNASSGAITWTGPPEQVSQPQCSPRFSQCSKNNGSTTYLLTILSNQVDFISSISHEEGSTHQWMSSELLDPGKFGLKDSRPTQESDYYALGMVIYEVLS